MPESDELFWQRFQIEKTIGQGSYGKVKLAYDSKLHRKVAIKIVIKDDRLSTDDVRKLKREIKILKLLKHPHIVELLDFKETTTEVVLIMEYIEGCELFELLVSPTWISESKARSIFRQLVSAIDYCHSNSVIHRDLKAENVLMTPDHNVKIIDFGFVNFYDRYNTLESYCGSPLYLAPEMVRRDKYFGPEVDIWSLGVILFSLLTKKMPFGNERDILTLNYKIPENIPPDAADLIKCIFVTNPNERIHIHALKLHAWVIAENDGPPLSYIPFRVKLEHPLDDFILDKMRSFGHSFRKANESILSDQPNAAKSLYYLLSEQYRNLKIKGSIKTPSRASSHDSQKNRKISISEETEEALSRESSEKSRIPLSSTLRKSLSRKSNDAEIFKFQVDELVHESSEISSSIDSSQVDRSRYLLSGHLKSPLLTQSRRKSHDVVIISSTQDDADLLTTKSRRQSKSIVRFPRSSISSTTDRRSSMKSSYVSDDTDSDNLDDSSKSMVETKPTVMIETSSRGFNSVVNPNSVNPLRFRSSRNSSDFKDPKLCTDNQNSYLDVKFLSITPGAEESRSRRNSQKKVSESEQPREYVSKIKNLNTCNIEKNRLSFPHSFLSFLKKSKELFVSKSSKLSK